MFCCGKGNKNHIKNQIFAANSIYSPFFKIRVTDMQTPEPI